MPPKKKAGAVANGPARPTGATTTPMSAVTIQPPGVPPASIAKAEESRLPDALKFVFVVILSLSLSMTLHTFYSTLNGPRLDVISPDGNPQWQVLATIAWKVGELACGWYAGFDAQDVVSLNILTHAPHLYLLYTYYMIPFVPLAALFTINTFSAYLPIRWLRAGSAMHLSTTPDTMTDDSMLKVATMLLGTLSYTLPYLVLTTTGYLPVYLATHFTGLRTLEAAHSATLPGVTAFLLPLGWAATRFFFVPAAHSLASASATTLVRTAADPADMTLSQTLHRNIFFHLYQPARAQELFNRIVTATLLTLGHSAFWAWMEVEGVEAMGALGWAGVWASGCLATGLVLRWVGGLSDA